MAAVPIILGASALASFISGRLTAAEQQRRYNEFQKYLDERERDVTTEARSIFSRRTRGQIARHRAATARRLQALGFASEAESFTTPGEAMIAAEGNRALKDFLFDTKQYFNQARVSAAGGFAGRSIQPTGLEAITELAPAAISYFENEEFLKKMGGIDGGHGKTQSSPTTHTESTGPVEPVTDLTEPKPNAERAGDSSWAFNFTKPVLDPFSGRDLTRFSRGGLTFRDLARRVGSNAYQFR